MKRGAANPGSARWLLAGSCATALLAGCAATHDAEVQPATLPASAPSSAAPAPPPPPPVAELPLVIYYASDVYALQDADKAMLQLHAKRLMADSSLHLRIESHTDATGSLDYNLALARVRGQTVLKQLIAFGVPAAQLQLVPVAKPVHPKSPKPPTAEDQAAERRVDLSYR